MAVSALDIKSGTTIRTKDGAVLSVRGCYMSETGIVLTCKAADGDMVERNVPLDAVESVVQTSP